MSYRRTFVIEGYFLLKDMSCGKIYCTGGHILLEACFMGENVLEEDLSYRRMLFCMTNYAEKKCLRGGLVLHWCFSAQHIKYARRICLTEGHVLLEDMSYESTCFTGGHVLVDQMYCCKTLFSGGHVVLEDFFHKLFIHIFFTYQFFYVSIYVPII